MLESGNHENLLKQKFKESITTKEKDKQPQDYDPILELLQNEPVEILEDKGMEVESEPLSLNDYHITPPKTPTDQEDTASNLEFMQAHLCSAFKLPSNHSVKEAISLIDHFEEDLK